MSSDLIEHPDERADAPQWRRPVLLVALSLTFGVVQLDATIVNVALQTLRTDLAAGWTRPSGRSTGTPCRSPPAC